MSVIMNIRLKKIIVVGKKGIVVVVVGSSGLEIIKKGGHELIINVS